VRACAVCRPGYPRVYRRFLEANRRLVWDRAQRQYNGDVVKRVMRLPNQVAHWWRHGPSAS
jgi:hypothetical protein